MKNFILIILLLLDISSCQRQTKPVKNHPFVQNQVNAIKGNDKILALEFWAPTCGPCIRIKQDIFENEQNAGFLARNFEVVKIPPSDSLYKSLFKFYSLKTQSTVLFFDKNGVEIERTAGYDGNKEFYMSFLKDVAERKNVFSDVYKKYLNSKSDIQLNYLMGKKLLLRYENKEAVNHFKYILNNDLSDEYGYLPECAFRVAEYDYNQFGKIERLQKYVNSFSKNEFMPQAYLYLIKYYQSRNDQRNCVMSSAEALHKFPFNPDFLNKHAWNIYLYRIKEDYNEALEMVETAIRMNPDRAAYWDTQAWLYYESGKVDEAIQSEKRAIKIFPHHVYKDALNTFESI